MGLDSFALLIRQVGRQLLFERRDLFRRQPVRELGLKFADRNSQPLGFERQLDLGFDGSLIGCDQADGRIFRSVGARRLGRVRRVQAAETARDRAVVVAKASGQNPKRRRCRQRFRQRYRAIATAVTAMVIGVGLGWAQRAFVHVDNDRRDRERKRERADRRPKPNRIPNPRTVMGTPS